MAVDSKMASASLEESCPILVDVDTSIGKMHVPMNALPQEIDTPLFRGRVLFIHRQPGKWAYEHLFVGKKRTFEFQMQGRFKKPPANRLYVGIETPEPMKLGVMTRALSHAVLSLMQAAQKKKSFGGGDSHSFKWSFGENQRGGTIDYPLSYLCNILDATPPGMTPPQLGTPELHARTHMERTEFDRLLSQVDPKTWEEGHVFTFTFHTMYLDFSSWTLANIPGMGTLSLETFWGKTRWLDILIFSAPAEEEEEEPEQQEHFVHTKLRWVGDAPIQLSVDDNGQISSMLHAESQRVASRSDAQETQKEDDVESCTTARNSLEQEEPEEEISMDNCSSLFSVDLPAEDLSEEAATPEDADLSTSKPSSKDRCTNQLADTSGLPLLGSSVCVPWYWETLDASHNLSVWFCFEWPTSASNSPAGKSWCLAHIDKVLLALNQDPNDEGGPAYSQALSPCADSGGYGGFTDHLRRRRSSNGQLNFRGVALPMASKKRLKVQALEYIRHSLLALLASDSTPHLWQVLRPTPGEKSSSWLLGNGESCTDLAFAESKVGRHSVIHEGLVGAVHFEGRICLELLSLGVDRVLRVYGPNCATSSASVPRLALELSKNLTVRTVPRQNDFATGVLGEFFFFEICCTEKILVFATSTEASRDAWISILADQLIALHSSRLSPRSNHPKLLEDMTDACRWHPRRRVVLNDRHLLFCGRQSRRQNLSPVDLSAHVLGLALSLASRVGTLADGASLLKAGDSPISSLESGQLAGLRKCLVELSDASCLLKAVRLDNLSAKARVAFWLNVYHSLLIHGFLVLGVPMSVRELLGFHNHASYLIGSQPFSLVEIEHGVLRTGMSMRETMNGAFFRLVLAQWQRAGEDPLKRAGCLFHTLPGEASPPDMIDLANWNRLHGLEEVDMRINYCLNCGNVSNLPDIPVFSGDDDQIESQLEFTSGRYLDQFTVVQGTSGPPTTVTFPRVVKTWQKGIKSPTMSNAQWLKSMSKYLSPEKAARIQETPMDKLHRCQVKYLPYQWDHHSQLQRMQFPDHNKECSSEEELSRKTSTASSLRSSASMSDGVPTEPCIQVPLTSLVLDESAATADSNGAEQKRSGGHKRSFKFLRRRSREIRDAMIGG